MHLLGHCIDAGRGLVLAVVNKWDGIEADERGGSKSELGRRLQFAAYAETHFISALHGSAWGIQVDQRRLPIRHPQAEHQYPDPYSRGRGIRPPAAHDRRPPHQKLRYAHAGRQEPAVDYYHGNQTDNVPNSYQRYLEKPSGVSWNWSAPRCASSFAPVKIPSLTSATKLTGRQVQPQTAIDGARQKHEKSRKAKKR